MTLALLIAIPLAGGLLAWAAGRAARAVSVLVLLADLALALTFCHGLGTGNPWMAEVSWPWVPSLGISLHFGLDGLSLILVLLTLFLGLVSVLTSWREIDERVGFFHFNLLWVVAGILGAFLALDLFLFTFFWELMLVPMYFLIAIWGHENRRYAALKFFIFTQASGLLMFLSVLALYIFHGRETGDYSFDYNLLLVTTGVSQGAEMWVMLGFLAAFLVKLPAVPLHNWLPDAHTQAPTAGSVILAGLLLKTVAYGILRFVLPLFPSAAAAFAPWAMALGALGILYGALLAFAQTDLKRLVAYTSVSHMGFVLLGAFAFTELALQGVVMQMVCHGLSTGALFVLVGQLYGRTHTRDMRRMGGLWNKVPVMGAVGMFFAMASLGLPGLGNFIAEFLVLVGSYHASVLWTVLATCGLVPATIYSLWIVQQVFHGEARETWSIPDLSARELLIAGSMMALLVVLGLYPQPVLDASRSAIQHILTITTGVGV